jgi:hypothetical protein
MAEKMNSEISRSKIKDSVIMQLWGSAAGRCELCNRLLYRDSTFGVDGNYSQNAHIHAVSEGGPRHKRTMQPEEINSIDNLMLLCQEHHHMIDARPENYAAGVLIEAKRRHEERVHALTGILDKQASRIVTYFSNIDTQEIVYDEQLFRQAMVANDLLPLQHPAIRLHAESDVKYERTTENFVRKANELEIAFKAWFDEIVKKEEAVSIFALAPQPLLIKLGTLINDQYNSTVFQCHRFGHKWAWKVTENRINFKTSLSIGDSGRDDVALVVDLSARVEDDRVRKAVGQDISIYHITIDEPNMHFVESKRVQDDFVMVYRQTVEKIKNLRPQPKQILLFPVMPNSLAVRLGMDYMPKTDLAMVVYDEDKNNGGFFETITIGG